MPRAEMLERMSSAEITEWLAFAQLEPFGAETQYIGHAITAATLVNVNRSKGKAAKPEDFMPKFERRAGQDVSQMIQVAQMITATVGGQADDEGE